MTGRKKLTFWGADADDDSLVREVIAGRKSRRHGPSRGVPT
jgi:hypothetical protein